MNKNMIVTVILALFLLFCTTGSVGGNELSGDMNGSSADEVVWIDGTPLIEKMLNERNGSHSRDEAHFLAKELDPEGYEVGDVEEFPCIDFNNYSECTINATCEAVGEHCYLFVEEGQTVPEAVALADAFDKVIYPKDTEIFGNVSFHDGFHRIFIVFIDIRDEVNQNGSGRFLVFGYFNPDLADDMDLICINTELEEDQKKSTIAHEFQHLIHNQYDPEEWKWVDEGCAMYASLACVDDEQTDQIRNYFANPDVALKVDDEVFQDPNESDAHYGASYLWTLYISENYGDFSNRSGHERFIRDLVANQNRGMRGIDVTLALHGYDERSDDIFKQWVVANYRESEGADPPMGYASFSYGKSPNKTGTVNLTELNASSFSFPEKAMESWSVAYYEVETDNPERITCSNDQDFWNTSFVNNNGDVIIVLSPLDDKGNVTLTVSEELQGIIANFTANKTFGSAPLEVQFTDTSTGSIQEWSWDFGDNETSSEQNPVHTYTEGGIYTVSLTVTGTSGTSDSEQKEGYITVMPIKITIDEI